LGAAIALMGLLQQPINESPGFIVSHGNAERAFHYQYSRYALNKHDRNDWGEGSMIKSPFQGL
jgi:hypothetical protein